MNEQQVRQIVQDELNKNRYQTGKPIVSRHEHNGIDNIKVNRSDVVIPFPINGTIDMAQQTTYTLNLTGKGQIPTSINFYGGAYNISSGVHAMIIGNAQNGANQQFQPSSTTSVITGSSVQNIIQGSVSMTVVNGSLTFNGTGVKTGGSNATSFLKNSQGHIIYAEYPSGTLVAVADVISVSNSSIQVKVTTLLTNWEISGLWVIT